VALPTEPTALAGDLTTRIVEQVRAALAGRYAVERELGALMPRPSDVLWYLERGRVAERFGDRFRAREAYHFVAAAWRHPDPELEPYGAEAREGLKRLSAELRQSVQLPSSPSVSAPRSLREYPPFQKLTQLEIERLTLARFGIGR
jgi:hypothetical protein